MNRSLSVDAKRAVLMPTRYGSASCGVEPQKNGNWLRVSEVYQAIDLILDDDEAMVSRLHDLLFYLRQE